MINIEELIVPIPQFDDQGNITETDKLYCGRYLKYDRIYDEIIEHRREDDVTLSQGIWQIDPKKASWESVKEKCEYALKHETKDLQIAMWLLESLIAIDGFSGLNGGIVLLCKLCEKFWNNIYPQIDASNNSTVARMAPFHFFSEKIPSRIYVMPLTSPTDGISNAYSLSDWISTRHNLRIKNSNGLSLKDLQKSVLSTPLVFFEGIEIDIGNVIENTKIMADILNKFSPTEAPSFTGIYDIFREIEQINKKNLMDKKNQMQEDVMSANNSDEDSSEKISSLEVQETNDGNKNKLTIKQAYETLDEIAAFLEKEQPQSPASALVKIANVIGKKTFQELLEINTQNGGSVINTIYELYKFIGIGN
jgi:type VI secretion system protein ImpA